MAFYEPFYPFVGSYLDGISRRWPKLGGRACLEDAGQRWHVSGAQALVWVALY